MCVEERLVFRCVEKVSVGLPEGRVFCCVWKKDQYCVVCMWKKDVLDCVCEKEKSVFRCVEEKVSECATTKSSEITYYREI